MKDWNVSFSGTLRVKLLLLAAALCVIAAALSVMLGVARISPAQLWDILRTGDHTSAAGRIFFYIRLPRTAAALAAGAGLGVAGVILQAVLANPLAAPNIIGVNAGAALGVTIGAAAGFSGWAMTGASFFGALAAVMLVVALARATGASRLTVVLSGVAVNALLNAVSDTLRTLFPDTAMKSADFRVGGFSSISGQPWLWPAIIAILMGLVLAFALSNEMDLLSLGEAAAHGLGLSVPFYRTLLLVSAALLAGASVSFCGLLGFVGLIVPHLCRLLVGPDSRWLIPISALTGAALVTLCDLCARLVFAPYELPAGIFLSSIGVPCFLFLLMHQRGGRTHD